MTTGINEARGWESIALPFDVKSITHSYKGSLVPFAKWSSQTDTKPFWLYELGSSGFVAVSEIKANKPYIISMPNNSQYDDRYNVDGVVTFTATNATVKSSDNLQNGVFGEKTFIPNFVNGPSRSNIYVLNVVNSYSTHSGAYASGSRFVKNLRAIHPFEAYITLSGNSAKESIPIFDDTTTWIQGIETMTYNHERGKVYNLNGQQIKLDENRRVGELQKGIYIINGKKIVIK